jgi:hypothetical protein
VTADLTAADEPQQHDDFLAFWRAHRAKDAPEIQRILGVDVPVPTELPLALAALGDELATSEDQGDVERIVTLLFGEDVYQRWVTAGLTAEQLAVLMAWGMANATGTPTTFAEAAQLAADAEAAGKARKAAVVPNRAARRASSRTPASASTGGSSSRTSAASTASPRKRSRT